MNLYDARSYFDLTFEDRVADELELERQLIAHRMEADYIKAAILELARFGALKRRARKLSPAARTLAGQTILELVFAERDADGVASYGKVAVEARRRHRRAGCRTQRVFDRLERDGVLVVRYGHEFGRRERTDKVTVELADGLDRVPLPGRELAVDELVEALS